MSGVKTRFNVGLSERHRQLMAQWVTEQGIDPNDVPIDTEFETSKGMLTIEVFVRDEAGECQLDPQEPDTFLRERRTVPLRTPFPHEAWMDRA